MNPVTAYGAYISSNMVATEVTVSPVDGTGPRGWDRATLMSLGSSGWLGPFPFLSINFFRSVLRYSNTCARDVVSASCAHGPSGAEMGEVIYASHGAWSDLPLALFLEISCMLTLAWLHGLSGRLLGESYAWSRRCAYQVQNRFFVLLHMLDTEQPALAKQLSGCPLQLMINNSV
jgi:hypothetical protein